MPKPSKRRSVPATPPQAASFSPKRKKMESEEEKDLNVEPGPSCAHNPSTCPCCISANNKIAKLEKRLDLLEEEVTNLRETVSSEIKEQTITKKGKTVIDKKTVGKPAKSTNKKKTLTNKGTAGLLDLPEEILQEILKLLPFSDWKNMRQVSMRLREIDNEGFSHKMLLVVKDYGKLDSYVTDTQTKILNLKVSIQFSEFKVLSTMYKQRTATKFWEKYGSTVTSVQIFFNLYSHDIVMEICKKCPNLEELSIFIAVTAPKQAANFEKFPKIKNLKLQKLFLRCNDLNPMIFSSFVDNTHLKSLSIEKIMKVADFSDIARQLQPILKRQLTELTLHCNRSFFYDIDTLFNSENQLTLLELGSIYLSENYLALISQKSKELKGISFDLGHKTLPLLALNNFFSALSGITCVDLSLHDSNPFVGSLANLDHLQCLRLFFGNSVTDENIISILGPKLRPTFTHLHLDYLSSITNRCIEAIMPNLPNLTTLRIKDCKNLSYGLLKTFCSYNSKLNYLSLKNIQKAPYSMPSIIPDINNLKRLVHLSLVHCEYESFDRLNLCNLKTIVVPRKTKFSSNVLEEIFQNCKSLDYVLSATDPGYKKFDTFVYPEYSGINRLLRKELLYLSQYDSIWAIPRFRCKV